ncbi:MAG TPA: endolytic transglycosylase MltG [Candidatus Saccharimonadales bacterium]|nr:endolytic transglycosylase MltG [Candidatus Saccharimonadales bacterium]
MNYRIGRKIRGRLTRRIKFISLIIFIVVVGLIAAAFHIYENDLRPPSNNTATQLFTIPAGSSVTQIATNLQHAGLIRSALAFQIYMHLSGLASQVEAGTYDLSPSQSLSALVSVLTSGKVSTKLVTILPGRRIDQVRADLINSGFSPSSVDNALNPSNYADVPVLSFKPAGVTTLEGLLWPDSFQKTPETDPTVIVRESLEEMSQHLNAQVQQQFAAEGLSPYQGLTLASIINQEVSKPSDQTQVAQVFLSRLKANSTLGSDVTALYGALQAGHPGDLGIDTPYNTLLHHGLPPTPISTISSSALYAATHPAPTNWLYFVAGDNGNTYFSTDLATHQQQAAMYCHKLCGQ